jgi:hypothetical protein
MAQEWDWMILVNERTDDEGWEFGGCCWLDLRRLRLGGRNYPTRHDCVRRRMWVHKQHADEVRSTSKVGAA